MHMADNIDFIAFGGKCFIEFSHLDREVKELAKAGVDLTAKIAKEKLEEQAKQTKDLVAIAQACGLQRVVAFPCTVQGMPAILYKMYGGNIPQFCKQMGITSFSQDQYPIIWNSAMQQADSDGIILYEKK